MLSEQKKVAPVEADALRLKHLNYKVHEYRIEKAWRRFTDAGFEPLLIKGWAAAQNYTNPLERQFNDVDLIVAPEDFQRAELFWQNYTSLSGDNTAIDLHCGARHLDTLSYEDLYAHSRSALCGQTEIRVLRPEDHLRVLCVHWLNDGGAKREKLWDIFYAVANRPPEFEWERSLDVVSSRRKRWIVCAVGLAHKYLGLDVRGTPLADEVENLPKWLSRAVEKEWRSDVPQLPLHLYLHDRREFWRQIKKRFPPNAIQATIEMEGDFDNKPRAFYQIGDMLYRLGPSVRRIVRRLKTRD